MITDTKIASIQKDGSTKVQDRSGLYLIKRGNSKYFEGKFKKKTYPLGAWNKNVKEILESWISFKKNPTPQLIDNAPKTLGDLSNVFMEEVYKPKTKERTWKDRQNKLNQMLKYLGEETLISEFELRNGGRQKIKKMLKDLFESNGAHNHLVRCRQFLKQIFDFAEDERYFPPDENPAYKRFHWEGLKHVKKGNKHLKWKEIPPFLESINENSCNASKITELASKAYLMLGMRVGAVVRMEWEWFEQEQNIWIIPAQTSGLKRLKKDTEQDHHIPSTPELEQLMEQIKKLTGWQKYVFYSFNGKKYPHLGEETINDHFKNLGWGDKQSAHGWRDVFTEGCLENGFAWELISRCLGQLEHKQGTRGHYDDSLLIEQRRELMEWWTSELFRKGLKI